jgi:glutathione S-transferase
MHLLSSPASPFVRKVRVLIREAGLQNRVIETPVATTPLAPAADVVAANPTGRIPVLVRDDGPAIYDSRVICRYLDDLAGAGLYPKARLWEVLTIEATADGLLDSAVQLTYETRLRAPEMQSQPLMDAHWAKITSAVAALGDRWLSHLNGALDMGQIAVGCALGYLDFRHDARGWRGHSAPLADWYARFATRASMVETVPQ